MTGVIARIKDLLKAVAGAFLDWPANVKALAGLICAIIARCLERLRLPNRLDRSGPQRCVKISDPAFKRPDPLIYAQYYLMAQGLAVTWDNPDIELRQGGVAIPPNDLKPDTEYDIVARVWNSSTEAPVVDLPVRFSFLSFGIGTQSHHIGQTTTNLGVKGGVNHPAFPSVKWRTPAAPGHYCIQVFLDWLDDVNPANNLGQDNTTVGIANSPAKFAFQLRNPARELLAFRFEVDAYALPELPRCNDRPRPPKRRRPMRTFPGTIENVPTGHGRGEHPLPQGWHVALSPAEAVLGAGEEITIEARIEPPAGFSGRQPVNVHAFSELGLAGGVTLYVER